MADVWVDRTEHFSVGFEADHPEEWDLEQEERWALAKSILEICEGDYARLKHLFGVDLPWHVEVRVDRGPGGSNPGGPEADGKTYTMRTGDGRAGGDFAYQRLRTAFIAELSEIFMVAQKGAWNPGDSKGEALSRVLSMNFYPAGQRPFFTVHQWIDNFSDPPDAPTGPEGLEDWVTTTHGDDKRAKSIGCGVAFLHYLRYQRGYSFEQIVSDQGATLADVYRHLAGDADAFGPFARLVRGTFPAGHRSRLNEQAQFPNSDMIFPLFEAGLASGTGRRGCARNPDQLDIFYVDDRSVKTAWWHAGDVHWHPYPIGSRARAGSPLTSVARYPGHLDVFWIDLVGDVCTAWWDAGQKDWHPYPVGGAQARGDSPLALVARNPDHLDLFWIGADGTLWTAWWDSAVVGWHPYPIARAVAARGSGLGAFARNPFYLDVFFVGSGGAVTRATWDARHSGWAIETITGSSARAGSPVAALARYPDHFDVFWIGGDNRVQTAWWDEADRTWYPYPIDDARARADSPLAVVARNPDHLDLFWVGEDDNVHTAWWDAGEVGWHAYPISGLGARAHSPLDAIARKQDHLDVFWEGVDDQVDTAWWDASERPWHSYAIDGTHVGDSRLIGLHDS